MRVTYPWGWTESDDLTPEERERIVRLLDHGSGLPPALLAGRPARRRLDRRLGWWALALLLGVALWAAIGVAAWLLARRVW